jgi:hypothetical protein
MKTDGEKRNVIKKTLVSPKGEKRYKERYDSVSDSHKARYLVEKFMALGCDDAPNCFYYFVKCFKNLSENTIWSIYENAANNPQIKSPIKYFIGACRNQMQK